MGLVYAMFLTIVIVKTNALYVKPSFISQDGYVNFGVKQGYLDGIQPNEQVCLIGRHMGEDTQTAPTASLKYAFVYSSYFHPEIEHNYSIQTAFDPSNCGDRRMIPSDLK